MKILIILFVTITAVVSQRGAPAEISADDPKIEKLLNDHLPRLATGDGGNFVLISKSRVTSQVVEGLSYKITGQFKAGSKDAEDCTVSIWAREWLPEPEEKFKIKADCSGTVYRVANDKPALGW
jgi:Cystatin domain